MTNKNWEITAGREVSWNGHQNWWVMTWIINGGSKQASFSPFHVLLVSDNTLLIPYAPDHAVKFGNQNETAGRAGDRMHYILPSNIWARMPLEIPAVPNVEMFFEKLPSGLALPLT